MTLEIAGPWRHETIRANGIRFHTVTAGQGPLILLLHGFPELWYSWRSQIPALAAAGYRVVAPDLRGYNDTEKPRTGYDMNTLVQDTLALLDYYGGGKGIVVGHDWGGAIAWMTAIQHPDRVERLAVLNLPHPSLFARALQHNPRQWLRSSYILLFRLIVRVPGLPEWLFSRGNGAALERIIRRNMTHPERLSDADMAVYHAAIRKPGALRAGLRYYASLTAADMARLARGGPEMMVHVPTLLLWGEKDIALGRELTYGTTPFVPDLTLHYLEDASHWVQQDQPEEVNRILLQFLARRCD